MKATFLLVILLSYFGATAAQEACTNLGDSVINGATYENAPNGTVVATLSFAGDPDEIVLYFDVQGNVATYFEIVGTDIKVKDSNLLSRKELGFPNNQNSVSITGVIRCNDTTNPDNSNNNVGYSTTITMIYTNNEPPKAVEQTVQQTEYVATGTIIFTVSANDGDDTDRNVDLEIASQTPEGYFKIDGNGRVTLIKDLDYSVYTEHTVVVKLTDTGFDRDGNVVRLSANQPFAITILDYDNLPPEFQLDGETFYSANIYTNKTDPLLIEPQSIKAIDGDTENKTVIYSFEGGTNNYDRYFEINRDTGKVTFLKSVENTTTFAITVKAAQEDRPSDRFSTTYLQIIATAEDENKPVFESNSYNGRLLDDGSDIIFVENADTGGLLQLIAIDDDPDALVIYSIDPPESSFQISSQGYIFLQSSTTRASIESSFSVTAINVNADQTSVNRKSDPVEVAVTITEVTTQPTTEATTEPATTEGTTFAETTVQPTTEPTTIDETTTHLDTTIEPTTEADTTTVPETTMPTTTDQTTIPDTTTVPETTILMTTDQTTIPDTTTVPETTMPTTIDQTTIPDTTTVEDTTIYTSPEQTTFKETTTFEDTTIYTSPEQTTFKETTTVEDTTVYTSPEQTTLKETTTGATTGKTATTGMITDRSTAQITSASVALTDSTSTIRSTTPQPSSSESTSGAIISAVEMVPASTLYAVAASLSVILFLAILVIIYLIWRLMKINKDDKEPLVDPYAEVGDAESQSSSTVHQNGAYVEENETNSKGGYEDIDAGFTSAASAVLVTDLDAPDDSLERQQDAESIHSAPFDTTPLDTEPHEYQPENDGYEDIEDPWGPEDIQQDGEMANEDGKQPISPFQDELQRRAAEIAVAAAATAMIAKSVEASPEGAASAVPRSLELPPEVVQEEKTIRDDYISTEKIVTLKGYGDDGQDVKAVMKSIDIDMAPSNDVDDVRKQIIILEQLSEMDHPNILKFYGSYEKDGCLHFACKYAQNGSLQDKLRSGEMNDANTLMGIMADIGKGLQYLHAKNITHGNLWSKAIMLDAENNPMLTDIKGDSAAISDFSDVMRWQALEVNDQTSGCTPASDVWSYGTLMWEIVSQGAVPYADVPLLDLADNMREQQLPKPEACSESLFSIMTTCWNHDPIRRPDMYVINSNLSEKLLEDSNDHIRLELTNQVAAMPDVNHDYFDDLSPPSIQDADVDSDDADYTAF